MRYSSMFLFAPDSSGSSGKNDISGRRQIAEDIAKDLASKLGEEKKKDEKIKEVQEKSRKKIPWFLVISLVVFALFAAYYVIYPPIYPTHQHPVTKGVPNKWTSALDDCVNVLWAYKDAEAHFRHKKNGAFPASIADFATINPKLPTNCPSAGTPFKFVALPGNGYRIEAPDPAALGVKALYISSNSSVPVIEP